MHNKFYRTVEKSLKKSFKVLADSIAESAVTVDDVSYVIDSGLHTVTSYCSKSSCSVKSVEWISRENVRLRAGLAGRSRYF